MGQSTEELSGDIAETRRSLSSDLDALQDRVSPSAIVERRKAAAKDRVRSVREKVMGSVHDVRSSAAGSAQSATGSVAGSVQSATGSVQSAVGSVPDRVQGAPLAAGLVAFGAGMVISAMLPAHEKEAQLGAQLVDTAREPVLEQAKSVGQDVKEQLSDTAGQAAQEVKETATQAADRVKSEGQSAAESVKSDAQSS
jgi:uncharacterized protein YjbJ (UPF0337 family)